MKEKVIGAGLAALSAGLLAADEHKHWSYHGETGPAHWAELAAGELAVVAVEIDRGPDNAGLHSIFDAMPSKEGETRTFDGVDASKLLPAEYGYYAFMGSLTTPPCTDGVRWMVLKEPIRVSAEELKAFTKLYPNDARPVQPLNGRRIEVSR